MAGELLDRERHRALAAAVRERDTEAAGQAARELIGQGNRRMLRVLTALGRGAEPGEAEGEAS